MFKIIINFFFIYFVAWWMVLFCVLPFGVKTDKHPLKGNDTGAPVKTNLKKKIIITSIITLVLTSTYLYLLETGVIDFSKIIGRGF
jgi:predicted secreted protein